MTETEVYLLAELVKIQQRLKELEKKMVIAADPPEVYETDYVYIPFDDNTSHSGILKSLINQLVKQKFASRKEIEEEFIVLLQTKVYRKTAG